MFSNKLSFSSSLFLLYTQLTHAAFLRCYNGSLDDYQVIPLAKPKEIVSCINTTLPTVVYTFGYRGRPEGPATVTMLTAYIDKKKRNVILLDWEDEAKTGQFGIALGYALSAVPNAKSVGKQLGDALIQLSSLGINIADIHLIGHSLGAHLMGFAGRRVRENNQVITRITGLDPARTFFEGVFSIQGLDRTCAKFVVAIHTDPGGYGVSTSIGTVDIWPNFGMNGGKQPGCPIGEFEMFSPEDLCSHDRSWRYYAESLGAPTSFPCSGAENYDDWVKNDGKSDQIIYLGDLTSNRAKGNFYLNTRAEPPYGMGEEGLKPNENQTRKRRTSTLTKILKFLR